MIQTPVLIIPNSVAYSSVLNSSEKLLYAELDKHSDENGVASCSNTYLADKINVTTKSIYSYLKNLEQHKFIKITYEPHQNSTIRKIYLLKESVNPSKNSKETKNSNDIDKIINNSINSKEEKELFYKFLNIRQKEHKPNTPDIVVMLIEKIKYLSNNNEKLAIIILQKSIINNYCDVFPLSKQEYNKEKEMIRAKPSYDISKWERQQEFNLKNDI